MIFKKFIFFTLILIFPFVSFGMNGNQKGGVFLHEGENGALSSNTTQAGDGVLRSDDFVEMPGNTDYTEVDIQERPAGSSTTPLTLSGITSEAQVLREEIAELRAATGSTSPENPSVPNASPTQSGDNILYLTDTPRSSESGDQPILSPQPTSGAPTIVEAHTEHEETTSSSSSLSSSGEEEHNSDSNPISKVVRVYDQSPNLARPTQKSQSQDSKDEGEDDEKEEKKTIKGDSKANVVKTSKNSPRKSTSSRQVTFENDNNDGDDELEEEEEPTTQATHEQWRAPAKPVSEEDESSSSSEEEDDDDKEKEEQPTTPQSINEKFNWKNKIKSFSTGIVRGIFGGAYLVSGLGILYKFFTSDPSTKQRWLSVGGLYSFFASYVAYASNFYMFSPDFSNWFNHTQEVNEVYKLSNLQKHTAFTTSQVQKNVQKLDSSIKTYQAMQKNLRRIIRANEKIGREEEGNLEELGSQNEKCETRIQTLQQNIEESMQHKDLFTKNVLKLNEIYFNAFEKLIKLPSITKGQSLYWERLGYWAGFLGTTAAVAGTSAYYLTQK